MLCVSVGWHSSGGNLPTHMRSGIPQGYNVLKDKLTKRVNMNSLLFLPIHILASLHSKPSNKWGN
jgi:hypothetical protein